MKDLRTECMYACQLLKNTLESMEDTMEIAKMEGAPEHVGKILYGQAEVATSAQEHLEKLKKEYESLKEQCPATMLHIDETLEDFDEMKEDYVTFKNGNGNGNGGNPY